MEKTGLMLDCHVNEKGDRQSPNVAELVL